MFYFLMGVVAAGIAFDNSLEFLLLLHFNMYVSFYLKKWEEEICVEFFLSYLGFVVRHLFLTLQ